MSWRWTHAKEVGRAIGLAVTFFGIGLSVPTVREQTRQHWCNQARMFLFLKTESGSYQAAKLLMRYANLYRLDPLAFAAVVWRESRFNPNAHMKRARGKIDGGGWDRGYGGVCKSTGVFIARTVFKDRALARRIKASPDILYQPDLNMDITAANLRRLLDGHSSVHDIFDAYSHHNAGDEGKGSLENTTAVKNRYHLYVERLERFDWRGAR